jgi:hypothetical protein
MRLFKARNSMKECLPKSSSGEKDKNDTVEVLDIRERKLKERMKVVDY